MNIAARYLDGIGLFYLRLFYKGLSITKKKVCTFCKIIPKKFGKLKRLPYLYIIKEHKQKQTPCKKLQSVEF